MTDSLLQALETKPTTITGTVIHGNAWGRVIGFPTANIEVPGPGSRGPRRHYAGSAPLPGG